jgi:hypothetical protein
MLGLEECATTSSLEFGIVTSISLIPSITKIYTHDEIEVSLIDHAEATFCAYQTNKKHETNSRSLLPWRWYKHSSGVNGFVEKKKT